MDAGTGMACRRLRFSSSRLFSRVLPSRLPHDSSTDERQNVPYAACRRQAGAAFIYMPMSGKISRAR